MAKKHNNATRRAILRERRKRREKAKVKKAAAAATAVQAQAQGQPTADATTDAPPPTPSAIPGTSATAPSPAPAGKAKGRNRHQTREMMEWRQAKKWMKHWGELLEDYKTSKYKAALAMEELDKTKEQIRRLNEAVNFLLKQPPNRGSFFSEIWGTWVQWVWKN